jgi:hypothetical protein
MDDLQETGGSKVMASKCKEYYPDIFEQPSPDIEPDGAYGRRLLMDIDRKNAERRRLYVATRFLLRKNFSFDPDDSTTPDPQAFPGGFGKKGSSPGTKIYEDLKTEEKTFFLSIYGYLLANNFVDPSFGRQDRGTVGPLDEWVPKGEKPIIKKGARKMVKNPTISVDGNAEFLIEGDKIIVSGDGVPPDLSEDDDGFNVLVVDRFIEELTQAVKVFNANKQLYSNVLDVLITESSKVDKNGDADVTVYSKQLAEITRRLIDDRVDATDPQLKRRILGALDLSIGGGIDGRSGQIDIDLPDLEAGTAVDIVSDNVRAVAAVYFSAMLEEMKFYAVMEKVSEHFLNGMLPITRGTAGEKIFEWIRGAPQRFNEVERRSVYGRVLGLAQGGATDLVPNREFSDLWLRFLSTVSLLSRDAESTVTKKVAAEQVHKTARDLSVNLSLHGYGVAHFAAVEMQKLIRQMKEMLSRPELLTAYGVNDCWQLTDRVSALYLNGSINGVRYRTMARSGADIMMWLADRSPQLASVSRPQNLNFEDPDLVFNVERWLAVTGTGDAMAEKYTEPVDLQQQPTLPMMPLAGTVTPQTVRSTLERIGLGAMPAAPGVQ